MSVGLPELDDDHKGLIRIINQLADGTDVGSPPTIIRQSIVALMRYAEFHFAREERVLNACRFPQIDGHVDEHRKFVDRIQEIAAGFEENEEQAAATVNQALLSFLKGWLKNHILVNDMAYRRYVEGDPEARRVAQSIKATEVWWSG